MDYILGILTGIGLALYAGYYLNAKEKKRRQKQADDLKSSPYIERGAKRVNTGHEDFWAQYAKMYIVNLSAEDMRYISHSDELYKKVSMEERLKSALEREDFEEAARIRDLMNKQ